MAKWDFKDEEISEKDVDLVIKEIKKFYLHSPEYDCNGYVIDVDYEDVVRRAFRIYNNRNKL